MIFLAVTIPRWCSLSWLAVWSMSVPDRTTAVLRCSPEEFAVLQKNSREMEGEFPV